MENWENKVIDAGKVFEGKSKQVVFQATENIPEIHKLYSSCGCTQPSYDESTKKLRVTYNAKKVSMHLRTTTRQMKVSQSVTVTYKDGTKDVLSFSVIVKM